MESGVLKEEFVALYGLLVSFKLWRPVLRPAVKVKVKLEHVMKSQRGVEVQLYSSCNLGIKTLPP